jgi:hypothetical protein
MPPRATTPTTLPPLQVRSPRDRTQMAAWLEPKLNMLLDKHRVWWRAQDEQFRARPEPNTTAEQRAIGAAERYGDMKPLRTMYPQLAKFLQPPKQSGKGKKFQSLRSQLPLYLADTFAGPSNVTFAVWEAQRIQAIWKKYYRGQRPKGYSAEEIAAARLNVEPEQVFAHKRSRKLKPDEFFQQYIANGGEL